MMLLAFYLQVSFVESASCRWLPKHFFLLSVVRILRSFDEHMGGNHEMQMRSDHLETGVLPTLIRL